MEYGSLENVLKFLDERLGPELPEVMLVRDNKGQENERLIARVKFRHERVFVSIPVQRVQAKLDRFVGIRNAFHARFIHRMLNDKRCENLTPAIIEWALRSADGGVGYNWSGTQNHCREMQHVQEMCEVAQDWWANTSRPLPLFPC